MKRKLRRVTQPNMIFFFPVLLLFALLALIVGQYALGICELLFTAGLYILLYVRSIRKKRTLTEYIRKNNTMLRKLGDKEVPFPIAMIHVETMELHWYNKAFGKLLRLNDQIEPHRLKELIPELDLSWLKDGLTYAPEELQFKGRRYQVTGSLLPDMDSKGDLFFGMIYLRDQTESAAFRSYW